MISSAIQYSWLCSARELLVCNLDCKWKTSVPDGLTILGSSECRKVPLKENRYLSAFLSCVS